MTAAHDIRKSPSSSQVPEEAKPVLPLRREVSPHASQDIRVLDARNQVIAHLNPPIGEALAGVLGLPTHHPWRTLYRLYRPSTKEIANLFFPSEDDAFSYLLDRHHPDVPPVHAEAFADLGWKAANHRNPGEAESYRQVQQALLDAWRHDDLERIRDTLTPQQQFIACHHVLRVSFYDWVTNGPQDRPQEQDRPQDEPPGGNPSSGPETT